MRTDEQKNQYFYTSNFHCAVFLTVKGFQLVNVDWTNAQRAQFVFIDTPVREGLIRQFNYAERNTQDVMVDAREYEAAIKVLKDRLYQGRE